MVLLPSLGRGAEDFDPMALVLEGEGYRVLRPQPRGIGSSSSRPAYADLHDCSNDIASVIEAEGNGPAIMVGHAFGNRVSRLLATIRPLRLCALRFSLRAMTPHPGSKTGGPMSWPLSA
jgi:pimeloyl-ACP methyl ester carboxylesterase